jgi:hypothetical protein
LKDASEYADRFAENRIDLSVLPDLTDEHLKDLGITLGARLKMLRAIRELSGAVLASPRVFLDPRASAAPSAAISTASCRSTRRQLGRRIVPFGTREVSSPLV